MGGDRGRKGEWGNAGSDGLMEVRWYMATVVTSGVGRTTIGAMRASSF